MVHVPMKGRRDKGGGDGCLVILMIPIMIFILYMCCGCVFIEAEGIKYSRWFGGQEITGFKMKKTAKTLEVEFSKQKGTESKLVEAINELIKRLPVP